MHSKMTRRSIVKSGLIAGALVPAFGLIGGTAGAAALTPLDPNDPTAKALGYITQSMKSGEKCNNCNQFQGNSGSAQGTCTIFPGKNVAAAGWCMSWVKKNA